MKSLPMLMHQLLTNAAIRIVDNLPTMPTGKISKGDPQARIAAGVA